MKRFLRQRSQLEKQYKHQHFQQWEETLEWDWSSGVKSGLTLS